LKSPSFLEVAGQFVTGDLEVSGSRVPVAVTPEALQKLGGEAVVFVQTDQGFEARKVEVGGRDARPWRFEEA
jgi:cobalt-zinc-cadmium efflux system membrane fusion protein